jgi:hypothetical protein
MISLLSDHPGRTLQTIPTQVVSENEFDLRQSLLGWTKR